jgi:hypothetical protein
MLFNEKKLKNVKGGSLPLAQAGSNVETQLAVKIRTGDRGGRFIKTFFKKRFRIDFKNVQFDINQQSVLNAMFSQLNTTDNIESYRVNDNVIAVIDSISSRCICHFPPIPMSEKTLLTIFCAS